jgi:DNA-binding NtrC family response regulator
MNVLVVDDSKDWRDIIVKYFKKQKPCIEMFTAATGEDAIEVLKKEKINYILLDQDLEGDLDGEDVRHAALKHCPGAKIVIISASVTSNEAVEMFKEGVIKIFPKPVQLEKVFNFVCSH